MGGFPFGVGLDASPDYRIYDNRLDTFKYWPAGVGVKPDQLAKAGFRCIANGRQMYVCLV